jgi:stearoyl-CoA desaturase (Delta-9 desaturase)
VTVVSPPKPLAPRPLEPALLPRASNVQLVSAGLVVALPLAAVAFAVTVFWNRGIGWLDLGLAVGMYVFTGLGLSLGFHRLFSHKSFVPARWLKITLAIAGTMGIEGSVTSWVSQHRRHHAFTDRQGDPHSPVPTGPGATQWLRGLWHAHAGWLFVPNEVNSQRWAKDLEEDPDLAFITRTVLVWTVLSFAIPVVIGWLVTGTLWGAFLAGLWGGVVRVAVLHHVTWGTNSLCHTFGRQPYGAKDRSTNFAPLALLSFGDAWHNTHHAFPRSARHGADSGQIDISAEVIRMFERCGWATEVHWPRQAAMEKRRALVGAGLGAGLGSEPEALCSELVDQSRTSGL